MARGVMRILASLAGVGVVIVAILMGLGIPITILFIVGYPAYMYFNRPKRSQ